MRKLPLLILLFSVFISCRAKREVVAPTLVEYEILYPLEARNRGYEGMVLVKVLVDEGGRVRNAMIARTSGISMLDSAAVHTAKNFVFSPAIIDGEPTQLWVTLPVEFELKEMRIDLTVWFNEVIAVQQEIAQTYDEEKVKDLYNLYKRFINSTRGCLDVKINDYIKQIVLNKTAAVWERFWTEYPAQIILFFDIINRYPDSSIRFEAEEDFNEFFVEEVTRIRACVSSPIADSLINKLSKAMQQ
ncbi:MAG: energy transducer TonB [candidate division WOR-3 bacterium]|nr:MAG: energy transducer TonB [candidate division WOR-3 bacterium]